MSDYIKREDALVAIKNLYPGIPVTKMARQRWHDNNRAYMQCERAVESIPAADVAEVRHAKFMPTKNFSGLKCSACGARVKNGAWRTHKWCYACGAKMDGGEDDAAD